MDRKRFTVFTAASRLQPSYKSLCTVCLLIVHEQSGSLQEMPLKAGLLGMFTMLVKDGYFTQPNVDLPVIACRSQHGVSNHILNRSKYSILTERPTVRPAD